MAEVEKRAAAKLRSEIELVTDILTKEKKKELRALKKVCIYIQGRTGWSGYRAIAQWGLPKFFQSVIILP